MDKFITVYKASAGAGKTHTLTQDYIKLILDDEEAYKHVLAVTFTNKATDEMKQRILQELHKMASDPSSPDSERARGVLVKILHDYPAFAVSTIDKFFQSVMRAFARELGRMITYSVELDEKLVLSQAVDNMFSDLDKSENRELLEWLIEFSLDQIESGDSWKIQENISNLSKALFSEKFKVKSPNMSQSADDSISAVRELKGKIQSVISAFEEKCRHIGEKALAIMADSGLDYTDFYRGKSGPFSIFNHYASKERLNAPLNTKLYELHNNIGAWYPKKRAGEAYKYEEAYSNGLNDLLGELIEHHEKSYKIYNTASVVRKNLNSLAILGKVYSYILGYCKENNVVLLSETTELLSRIIDGNDTPFIYEKVGTWIDHFMLDEFQDTSLMQWNNFIPLLSNSIANGEKNLIVGDIKQSIYRFRNSDWSILQRGIEEKFPDKVYDHPLMENWRSAKNIIGFNNSFFEAAAVGASKFYSAKESSAEIAGWSQMITQIYSGFAQNASPKSVEGGRVSISFIDKDILKEVADSVGIEERPQFSYDSVVGAHILQTVGQLLERGYRQKDIGILVRSNKEGAMIARTLMEADPSYRVVSADSLFISSSAAVARIVNTLQWIDNPGNLSMSVLDALGEGVERMTDETLREHLKGMPLYQMCEEIVRCCLNDEQRSDVSFIQAFLDMVLEYSQREGSSLSGFMKWWNESGCNKSISSPDSQDAFQVMTIHKSKGLDFEVVILPYFKGMLDHQANKRPMIWSSKVADVFGYDGPLPVKYEKELANTLFDSDYFQERLETFVDNLNIAYVAFTRPRRELVIIADKPEMDDDGTPKIHAVSDLLYEFVSGGFNDAEEPSSDSGLERIEVEASTGTLNVGGVDIEYEMYHSGEELPPPQESGKSDYGRYVLGSQFNIPLDQRRLKTSLQSGSINEELTLRDNGIIMHDLFATITSKSDVDRVEDPHIREIVRKMIASVDVYGWFSDEYKVMKECTIIEPDGALSRPDRVMTKGNRAIVTDYKFGEFTPLNKKYHKQVQRYMQLLMEMGYTVVEGYLWYPLAGEVETVNF